MDHELGYQVLCGLIAVWGLLDLFFGLRIFKLTLALLGFFLGLAGGIALAEHYAGGAFAYILTGALLGAILGGLFAFSLYKIGMFCFAALAAYAFVAPWAGQLDPMLAQWLPVLVAAVVGLLVVLLVEPVIIIITAFSGAFRAFWGGYGLLISPVYAWQVIRAPHGIETGPLWMSLSIIGLGALGLYVQMSARQRQKS